VKIVVVLFENVIIKVVSNVTISEDDFKKIFKDSRYTFTFVESVSQNTLMLDMFCCETSTDLRSARDNLILAGWDYEKALQGFCEGHHKSVRG
jgi:hypothetical protein